ncbi:MAG: tRNA (adenosine(37)-N6)-threonylcarbamoyltransferase complex dimerization subunit type 1 TsaB [Treponema sp.]|nr:tRNA (adenosine(37)-N6)-threonylcarbamoyltransferase complex dimerization subunit type 1 TsaB [Treponema sp.]
MNILALDTSDQVLSVALSGGNGLWYSEIDAGLRHSELLLESIDDLFRISGLSAKDLDKIACMKGPGSFTGLRIGFSTAKGLAMALGIPLLSLPSLDCMAYPLSAWPGLVLPAIDAKKASFFAAVYRAGKLLSDYMDAAAEKLAAELISLSLSADEQILLSGPGAELLFERICPFLPHKMVKIDHDFRKGRAKELLEMAKSVIVNIPDDLDSGPLYIRKSDAELGTA